MMNDLNSNGNNSEPSVSMQHYSITGQCIKESDYNCSFVACTTSSKQML